LFYNFIYFTAVIYGLLHSILVANSMKHVSKYKTSLLAFKPSCWN